MKNKDKFWLDTKIQDIKKRKRGLKKMLDQTMVKKIKEDLKREYRAAKRSEKNSVREHIKREINKGGDNK